MISLRWNKSCALLASLLVASTLSAQTPVEELNILSSAFPSKDYAYSNYTWDMQLELNDDKIVSKLSKLEERMCLKESSGTVREGFISYSYYSTLDNVDVHTLIPTNNKYKKVKIEDFTEYDMDGGVFYDDSKTLKFHWPSIVKGAKQVQKINMSYNDPHFTPSFYTPAYTPIANGRFSLTIPREIEIEITPMNFEQLNANFTEVDKGKFRILTWEFQNYGAFKYNEDNGPVQRFAPHIIVRVKNYKASSGNVNVLGDVKDLHAWYCSMLDREPDDQSEIKLIVAEITSDAVDKLDAAKKIYRWVQTNIEYVAIEDGVNGFQPAYPSVVCSSRFGDCKGMSNLLHAMYNIYGINSKLTWIGTRDIYYTYDQVPTPLTDNHMVLTVDLDGKRYFLDATYSKLPFGTPSPMIQGKQALISDKCESFELVYIPAMDAETNVLTDSTDVYIDGKNLKGVGLVTLIGYSKMSFLQGIYSKDKKAFLSHTRDYLLKGSNRFVLDTAWLENESDPNTPMQIHYKFHIEDYLTATGNEQYLNLNLHLLGFLPDAVEKDRPVPLELLYKTLVRSISNLHLENEAEVTLPKNHDYSHDLYSYWVKYNQNGQSIRRHSEEKYNFIELPVSEFENWNELQKKVMRSYRESLIIKNL